MTAVLVNKTNTSMLVYPVGRRVLATKKADNLLEGVPVVISDREVGVCGLRQVLLSV